MTPSGHTAPSSIPTPSGIVNRTIDVDIVDSSWPAGRAPPPELKARHGAWKLDVHAVLAHIAERTAPIEGYGFTLAEHWAYLRYFGAVAGGTDLALASPWKTLDAHQKAVLSDDFGVGIASLLASEVFDTLWIVEPTAFIKRASHWVDFPKSPSRRGPAKSPDFMAFSPDGRGHVIEAKGTQRSERDRDAQIFKPGRKGAPPSGGRIQKRNIDFKVPGTLGERLVMASLIPLEGKGRLSLRVEDPPGAEPLDATPWADIATEGTAAAAAAAGLWGLSYYLRARGPARQRWRAAADRDLEDRRVGAPGGFPLVGSRRTFLLPRRDQRGLAEVRATFGMDPVILAQAVNSEAPGEVLHAWRVARSGKEWAAGHDERVGTWTSFTPNGLVFTTEGMVDTEFGCRAIAPAR
jgi:hypothetical protein